MTTNVNQVQNATASFGGQPQAARGLALVRLTIGAMFVWVFFENLGKGLYSPAGYAGLINYYIKSSHSPAAWKWIMGLTASHAALAAPMQATAEISLGILLLIGLLTRPVAFVAFLYLGSLWVSEWGTSWIWELLVPVLASLGLAQVELGASTRCWPGGAPRPHGGDERICVRVSVIIPTHNEAQAIGRVLADLPSNLVTEVIVVDSNSTDGTPDLAREMGAQVIEEPRRGYGRACLTGLANTQNPDVVVFLDGDYSDRPSELPIILAPIIEKRADITLGSRFGGKSNSGALPWHQAFGNRLAAGLIRLLYGVKVSDLGPFRAGRADVLRALALEEATYGWAVEMIVKGAIAGFRIVEVSVSYYPRIGKSKISGTLKGTVGAAWFILSRIVRYYFRRPRAGTQRPA